MTITPEDLVRREVCHLASSLVHTLAVGGSIGHDVRELEQLTEQAQALSFPLPDYESAALDEGWKRAAGADTDPTKPRPVVWIHEDHDEEADTAEEACELSEIEPYDREVFEHWIVTDWLADKLEARGEKVDKDFAGLTIWARTTTGQAIAMDEVISSICEELNAPHTPAAA
ncbi:hypothetical protein [Oceanicola sp. S124]|uniref:hypothetical protein n=1 Tax=Oceanicola sp. S124 TaxID=1042378 RepID=UPI000255A952|nr:hypothetical protein [Oceanicola sp. S124]